MTFPAVDTIATYGGPWVDSEPIADPTTDQSAAGANIAFASIAAMTHTALKGWVRFVTSATTPTLATSNAHDAAWGNAAPVAPVPTRAGTGLFDITYPSTVTDELGNTQSVVIRHASAVAEGSTAVHTQCAVTAPNVVRVYVFTMAGAAGDAAGTTIRVNLG